MSDKKRPTEAELLKPVANFGIIKFDYGREYVFKNADAIKIMELFTNCETLKAHTPEEGDTYRVILPLDKYDSPEHRLMSKQQYLVHKMSHLLGVNIEVKNE